MKQKPYKGLIGLKKDFYLNNFMGRRLMTENNLTTITTKKIFG
jgi:hypothetical protein